jgi:hypothetical protein
MKEVSMSEQSAVRFERDKQGDLVVVCPPELTPIAELLGGGLERTPFLWKKMVEEVRTPRSEPYWIGGANEYGLTIYPDYVLIDSEFTTAKVTMPRTEFLSIMERFAEFAENTHTAADE